MTKQSSLRRRLIASTALVGMAGIAAPGFTQLPTGETALAGTPTFDRSVTDALTIGLNDSRTHITWTSFDIGATNTVNFANTTGVAGNIAVLT